MNDDIEGLYAQLLQARKVSPQPTGRGHMLIMTDRDPKVVTCQDDLRVQFNAPTSDEVRARYDLLHASRQGHPRGAS